MYFTRLEAPMELAVLIIYLAWRPLSHAPARTGMEGMLMNCHGLSVLLNSLVKDTQLSRGPATNWSVG